MALQALNLALNEQQGEQTLKLIITKDEDLVLQSQRLRYKSFFAVLEGHPSEGVDKDEFDPLCDHLLVLDESLPDDKKVIGTYRLRRYDVAANLPFYTETEFDITGLKRVGKNLMELGRSCIHPDYRNGRIIQMLWRGLRAYVQHFDIDYMFGCASFEGCDPVRHRTQLSYIIHHHLAPAEICPTPLPEKRADFELLDKSLVDKKTGFAQMPPLMKGYLRAGVMVSNGAVLDPICNTVDVCVVMDTVEIASRYEAHFNKSGK